MRTWQQADLA